MEVELIVELLLQPHLVHRTTKKFWAAMRALPANIQELAQKQFWLLETNPAHPSLHFKLCPRLKTPVWEVYVTYGSPGYRALAYPLGSGVYEWFFIGTHQEVEKLLHRL